MFYTVHICFLATRLWWFGSDCLVSLGAFDRHFRLHHESRNQKGHDTGWHQVWFVFRCRVRFSCRWKRVHGVRQKVQEPVLFEQARPIRLRPDQAQMRLSTLRTNLLQAGHACRTHRSYAPSNWRSQIMRKLSINSTVHHRIVTDLKKKNERTNEMYFVR